MFMAFKLTVPVDHRFRPVVQDVTTKCTELAGGSAADGQRLAEALAETVSGMTADPHAEVTLVFKSGRGGVEVVATCAGRSATVHQAIPVSKP